MPTDATTPSDAPAKVDGRSARKEATRSRILAAAVELFAERGYTGTSLDDVAEAAGVSKGTIFYNFTSKAELFEALIWRAVDTFAADVAGARSGVAGWEALSAATLAVIRRVDSSPALAQILLTELFRAGRPWADSLAAARERLLTPIADVVREVAEERRAAGAAGAMGTPSGAEPTAVADNVATVAMSLIGALTVVTLDRGAFGSERSLEEVHRGLMTAISGLRGTPPAAT